MSLREIVVKNKIAHIPWILGIAGLLVFGGMAIQKQLYKNAPRNITYFIVERFFELPPSVTTVDFVPVSQDSIRQAFEDSLIALAKIRGELEKLARESVKKRKATIEDTVSAIDSLGSFYARAIHKLEYDGATNRLTKTTTYGDVKLTTVNTREEIPLDPSLWEIITSPYTLVVLVIVFVVGLTI